MRYLVASISLIFAVCTAAATGIENPGTAGWCDTLSWSAVTAGLDLSRARDVPVPQLGTGHTEYSLSARSYRHLNSLQTVWGDACFATGTIIDMKWCNNLDYDLIAPYVLGDTKGGNLDFRRYTFSGGYSRCLNDTWCFGASMKYRAEVGWRSRDPRVKAIVSDLVLSIGVSHLIPIGKIGGVSASVRSYTQNCDLDFYNPLNEIVTYPMTGLSTYYKRFVGNTNKNSGHGGLGAEFSAQLLSPYHNGVELSVSYIQLKMNEYLRNFNNIVLGYTNTGVLSGHACWNKTAPYMHLRPTIDISYRMRSGTENLFGTAAGASYDKIGSRKAYSARCLSTSLSVPVDLQRLPLVIIPALGLKTDREEAPEESRRLRTQYIVPAFSVVWHPTIGSYNLALTAGCNFSLCSFSKNCEISYLKDVGDMSSFSFNTSISLYF